MSASPAIVRSFPGLLAWWGRSLAAWLPASWRRHMAGGGDRLLLQPHGPVLQLWHSGAEDARLLAELPLPLPATGEGEGEDPLARLLRPAAARLPRWLLLPAAAGLRRALAMPAAAAPRLREVLGFEIERQTPFAADAVLHDARVVRIAEDGSLLAELVVVPRARADEARGALAPLDGGLAGIDLADQDGIPLGVNLLPDAQRVRTRNPGRRRNALVALVALAALVMALAQVLDNRRAAADALDAQVKARSAQARVVADQRQALVDGIEGAQWLQQQRAARPPTVEVLNALAQGLPDGTYVDKIAIEGGRLTVIGLSNQAASLVGRMQGAQQPWRNPALSGALLPDPATRLDRFTLVAELPTAEQQSARPAAAAQGVARGTP